MKSEAADSPTSDYLVCSFKLATLEQVKNEYAAQVILKRLIQSEPQLIVYYNKSASYLLPWMLH
jgi:hypothetical protein